MTFFMCRKTPASNRPSVYGEGRANSSKGRSNETLGRVRPGHVYFGIERRRSEVGWGVTICEGPFATAYRWHVPDPVPTTPTT